MPSCILTASTAEETSPLVAEIGERSQKRAKKHKRYIASSPPAEETSPLVTEVGKRSQKRVKKHKRHCVSSSPIEHKEEEATDAAEEQEQDASTIADYQEQKVVCAAEQQEQEAAETHQLTATFVPKKTDETSIVSTHSNNVNFHFYFEMLVLNI